VNFRLNILIPAAALLAVVFIWDRNLVMPLAFALSYSVLLLDFVVERFRIKSRHSIVVPRRKGRLRYLLFRGFLVFQGLVLVLSALATDYPFIPVWQNISLLAFSGILLMMAGLLRNKRYRLLLSRSTLTINEGARIDWNLREIQSVTIGRNRVQFHKSNTTQTVKFSETELDYPGLIGWRMKEILRQKQ
jgi:cellulose synthase/poly-beta-1,6-N-acetylglucosamine synthase-like glycosyltransferase